MGSEPDERSAWMLALVVAAIGAALFGSTWTQAVQPGGAEVVVASCGPGNPPGPGAPLVTLVGQLVCQLPWSTAAGRMGMLSLLAGVCVLLGVFHIVWRITGDRWAATVGGLSLATGAVFWRACSQAGPQTLGIALSIWALVSVGERRGSVVFAGLAGVALGLALCAFPPAALLVAPVVVVAARTPARLVVLFLGAVAGLAPLATADWPGLQAVLIGWDRPSLSGAEAVTQLGRFLVGVPAQTAFLLWPFVLAGGAALTFRWKTGLFGDAGAPGRAERVTLVLMALLVGPLFPAMVQGEAGLWESRVVMSYVLISLCVGVGLAMVSAQWLAGESAQIAKRRRFWHLASYVILGLAAVANRGAVDLSGRYAVEDHGFNCLSVAEKNAVVLGEGRVLRGTVAHAQLTRRPDVTYVDLGAFGRARHREDLPKWIATESDPLRLTQNALRRRLPVYFARPLRSGGAWRTAFPSRPAGPLLRLMPPDRKEPDVEAVARWNRRLFRGLLRRGAPVNPALDPVGAKIRETYARSWRWIGRQRMRRGDRRGALRAVIRGQHWAPWMTSPDWLKQ